MLRKEKQEELQKRMELLGIKEDDLIEKFILGSGSGGQKINKTSSCVYLKHIPTGIEVKCQQDRSREMNRFLARRELCDRFEAKEKNIQTKKQQLFEKIRRQKRRRSRRGKEKMLATKKIHGEKKSLAKRLAINISQKPLLYCIIDPFLKDKASYEQEFDGIIVRSYSLLAKHLCRRN